MAADKSPSPSSPTPLDNDPAEPATVAPETLTASEPLAKPGPGVLPPSRYQPLRFHAAGNLGEVLLAQDPDLNRAVALKRIQDRHADDPQSRRRFLREAELTGRLEHPGVVPVHGLGQDPDGRPCYAMRFIEGESLQEAIKRFHAADRDGGDPGEQRLRLRQLLTSFVTVCKTMAYAHSRGILHRDLKPANIMLGPYGETMVVVWGLAKEIKRDEKQPAPEDAPQADAAQNDSETQAGTMMGTPAYASPEQAAGHWELVGPASDIFSLGATLYNLLTNASPYHGSSVQEIIAQASMGDVIPPRRRKRDVPRALEAICLKAMTRLPEERYGTALDLAADVEHWLADQPVQAYPEPMFTRLGRWLRRHRPLVASLAAAAGVALVSLTLVLIIVAGKNRELTERAEAERLAKDAAEKRLVQIEKGTDVLGSIFEDLDPNAEVKEGKPLGEILGNRVKRAAEQLDGESIGDALTVAKLQYILGSSLTGLGHYAVAEALLQKSAATRATELTEDHADTLLARNNLADAYYSDGKLKLAIPIYEQTLKAMAATLGEDDLRTLSCRNNLGNAYSAFGKLDLAIPLLESTLHAREANLGEDHPDTLTARNNLATAYLAANHLDLATKLYQQTLKAREEKLGEEHPYTVTSRNNLAAAYNAAGRSDLALPLYERCLRSCEAKLGKDHPDTLMARNNLASTYKAAGKSDLSLDLYRSNLPIAEGKLGSEHSITVASRNGLAGGYHDAGKLDLAIPLYQRNLQICVSTLGDDHPRTMGTRNNLAMAYVDAGRLDQAMPLFEQVVPQARKKLGPSHRLTLRFTEAWIAALAADRQYDRALSTARELLAVQRKQYGKDDPRLAAALARLGSILTQARQPTEAETVLRESLAIRTKKDAQAWTTFETESLLGGALLGQKHYAEAEPLLLHGYEGMKERQTKIPPTEKKRLTEAIERLLQLQEATGKKEEAARWRQELKAARAANKKP
jgi:serine/threonine protein kinase